MSPKMIDKTSHPHTIQRAIMCHSTDLMLCFEKYSAEVKFYDYNLKLVQKQEMKIKTDEMRVDKAPIS